PGGVLDQDHLADADHSALAVAGGYFDAGVEIDDVLAAWCGVPVDIVLGLGFAKDNAGGRQAFGQFAAAPFLDPLHLDVAEMRLAAGIGIEIVYTHGRPPLEKSRINVPAERVTLLRGGFPDRTPRPSRGGSRWHSSRSGPS